MLAFPTSMIAVFNTIKGFCVVRRIGRQGMSVKALSYCGEIGNAAEGVEQIPVSTPGICADCHRAITAA